MNVCSSEDSVGNSWTGDNCEGRGAASVQGGLMAVEMQKSLMDSSKGVKGIWVSSASFLRMLAAAQTEHLNKKGSCHAMNLLPHNTRSREVRLPQTSC